MERDEAFKTAFEQGAEQYTEHGNLDTGSIIFYRKNALSKFTAFLVCDYVGGVYRFLGNWEPTHLLMPTESVWR